MKLIVAFILIYSCTYSQVVFYQDVCNCGVTAAGFSTGLGFGSGNFNVHIEPGSTIKKAYMLSYRIGFPPTVSFLLNGTPFTYDTTNYFTQFNHKNQYASPMRTYYKDITQSINPTISNYTITIPDQFGLPINWGYWTFFLYIVYENPTLSKTSFNIIVNNQSLYGNTHYSISDLNPILNSFPVGFSIYTDRMGGASGSILNQIYFNSNFLGICGGNDNANNLWIASGVKGHFYYQNNQLFGLDDDTPDAIMGGTDGLADVSSYIQNNATSCNFQLTHINYPNQPANATSAYLAYFLTYTSPCQPFDVSVPKDTTICQGATIQLNASGGQSYEWISPTNSTTSNPAPGLSCSNCPNPIFTADSTMFYTVRIWNNDTSTGSACSVVRPVRINVLPQPQIGNVTLKPSECGTTNGSITITGTNLKELFAVSENGDTTSVIGNILTGLGAGNYTVFYTNASSCQSADTLITIGTVNNTIANFTATPQSGSTPLEVAITNTSQNAQQFQWFVNGELQPNPFSSFVADTSGSYQITLVAWKNDLSCADTAQLTVIAYDSLIVGIPNVFSPNNDGVNDVFSITVNQPVKCELVIVNRWGEKVYSYSGNLTVGMNDLWSADATISDGVYFYSVKIETSPPPLSPSKGGNPQQLSREGFVTVLR
ncbi:MAG: gliding motility-associated C-terminal domain-containing protein [Crocinitomicaceae bacterium]|nr:gliding motility-associated C-terminal domain-containing protein [Crocinitomicaceae bacterium]